ncbi:helicase [Deinococcus aerius]|uniref:Helicase n=1 Tax=Deinococcus aerius TaxID=200253 RepID=A0A2I9DQE0_9DEIO|nr:DEAD/DEAH box helicase family protein [Deinococcus aerius]GBF04417.1 helicase [Deinococcus aerius]
MAALETFVLPRQHAGRVTLHKNVLEQLASPEMVLLDGTSRPYRRGRTTGTLVEAPGAPSILVVPGPVKPPDDVDAVLWTEGGALPTSRADIEHLRARWVQPKFSRHMPLPEDARERALASWRDRFRFAEETVLEDGRLQEGLRSPQIGALHAALAHWKMTNEPATVVMPTGTGKTETMLALLVQQRLERLLVVVPNDALRTQISEKFLTLGLLKKVGALDPTCQLPVVCRLDHALQNAQQADDVFGPCNVVVTTMDVLRLCGDDAKARIVALCSHLFIDEAHHIGAKTWKQTRELFLDRKILQFTATPFRSGREPIPGRVIFNYPLLKAHEEEYFKPILFRPVSALDRDQADGLIITRALDTLDADLAPGEDRPAGFDHLVMARADNVRRAEDLHARYAEACRGKPYGAVLVYHAMPAPEKRAALEALARREARVVVCVNMFGEGFDLPNLKIAAMHDIHKSLTITLQFTGRFTRASRTLGNATLIANVSLAEVQAELRDLYAEDPDWNVLLRVLSAEASGRQEQLMDFLDTFQKTERALPIQNISPKMSAVVYRTTCPMWDPDHITDVVSEDLLYAPPTVSHREHVAVFVTRDQTPVGWGDFHTLQNVTWDVSILHWDAGRHLLYVHSSDLDEMPDKLARAVTGGTAERVEGETTFRCLHGIQRLTLTNLGLSSTIRGAVRFTMFMGSDIVSGLAEASTQDRTKSNIFGFGYERAERSSAGCSARGRLWSYQIAPTVYDWMRWCHSLGAKLIDDSIDVSGLLERAIKWRTVEGRPRAVPLAVEWSEDILARPEQAIMFELEGTVSHLYETGLAVTTFQEDGPLRFRVFTEEHSVEYEVVFGDDVGYRPVNGVEVLVTTGKAEKNTRVPLSEWLVRYPPTTYFHDRTVMWGRLIAHPAPVTAPFSTERVEAWDWTGTNIRAESQGPHRDPATVQYRVIQWLLGQDFDIVFDDDDTWEAADIVAIKLYDDRLVVRLYHCKYSGEDQPGARVGDLYEVCGQAQKSVHWRADVEGLFQHLVKREGERQARHGTTRFDLGDAATLRALGRRARYLRPEFHVSVVQPGVSKRRISDAQLNLLAVTELYLQETYGITFSVITSD